ncbi:hypothetical protein G5V57_14040 [Nordella sp. HKS 07]|uniref:vWA domain-containing protein n=1 Tax=Nordella sp. HKS 07 TaxID=2712222 RepID=UPI0013E112D0|nr:hypothetical protein [Nordella sp. HKS 07]QIG48747.1 hypothetical protein G5V57_14040 [Nordella sp. HKS 07]
MAPIAADKVAAKLKGLRARGKTPISQSLRQAASLLPADGGGTIILVSDGIETCSADPCAVARDLKRANPALTIHVVGFGLAKGEAAQLSCIAENAQGRFFDAGTARQLADNLSTITETIATTPPPQPAPEQQPVPQPEPPRIQRIGLAAVIEGSGPIVDAPVRWTVRNEKQDTVYAGESRGLSLDLVPGTYKATAEAANAQGDASFTVTDAEGQAFEIKVGAGRLDLTLAASKSAAPFSDLEAAGVKWTLEPLDGQGKADIPSLARPSLLLAPGRYKIGARLKGLAGTALATVTPGAPQAVTLDFKLGTVVLEAVLDGDVQQPIDDATLLAWRVGDGDKAQSIEGQTRPRLVLQEGTYPVFLSIAGSEVKGSADVRADEERVARIVVKGGELMLSARLGPQAQPLEDWRDAFWTLQPIGTVGETKALEIQEAAPTVPLPPGRWRLILKSGTVTVEQDIQVSPGSKMPLAIDLGGARLTARAIPASGEPAANIVYSVFALDAAGLPAASPVYEVGSSGDAASILSAGRWRVIALDSEGRQAQTNIELGIGEERTVEMTLN